ncbi:hypothetical protein AVEN_40964-1 [Araneus ventricosus]|uniref:Tc1-like transposase DDE domain-containing protein n=1 Tax=Araneus ventricosus TaxID=182803 RepID=A0A4Y2FCB2_ARAVE|nr:hypothetical protein AVEN_40964-1 [Araneus ventricosus]
MSIVHSDGLEQFQQDNATPHASKVATKWLQEHSSDFKHFHWPPKYLEMNIIEDIRDALLHAVEKNYEAREYLFLEKIEADIIAIPPGVDELTDSKDFDDESATIPVMPDIAGTAEI